MVYRDWHWDDLCCKLTFSFYFYESTSESHFIVEVTNPSLSATEQFAIVDEALRRLFNETSMARFSLVWKRFFVSDAVNQAELARKTVNEAVSYVQQPPLNGTKVAVWAYAVESATVYTLPDGATLMEMPNYSHIFHTGLHHDGDNSFEQSEALFQQYTDNLASLGMSLEAHCLRTWLFVQDIDIQYKGMVLARNRIFEQEGLTPDTHFIASTGIEGRYAKPETLVFIDAYSIREIQEEQITYLKGATHLNPTHEYGVSFERGTAVQYGDRKHIFISGTASINHKGEIVHPLDIKKQTERTLENIQVLLAEAGCTLNDAAHLIVYLRDTADYAIVKAYLDQHHPDIPTVILLAAVCRPGWLIEMECMAIAPQPSQEPRFKPF